MTLAHEAFALGYAEDGAFPVGTRAKAACVAVQESALNFDHPHIGRLIVEAGRAEGKRSKREQAHRRLYRFHTAKIAAAWQAILNRVDLDSLAPQLVQHAADQKAAGSNPVTRRRAVAGVAVAAIHAQVTPEDRQTLDGLNSAGWVHATAYGTGEAQATSEHGGPPDSARVAALTALALNQINSNTAVAASAGWTDLELNELAMGAAMAAGDGSALGDAVRAVKQSLVDDTDGSEVAQRAAKVYGDQLHAAVTSAYISATQAANPGARYDWVTASDPCPDCEDAEREGPYPADQLPDGPPLHPNCVCDLELESVSVGV